jgi:hypothetical protein
MINEYLLQKLAELERRSSNLPGRMVPSLKRWVVLGDVSADDDVRASRDGGGRV